MCKGDWSVRYAAVGYDTGFATTNEIRRVYVRRFITVICLLILLAGCGGNNAELDKAMTLRKNVISAEKCSFRASITAEYDDIIHSFDLKCETEKNHEMLFEVVKPDTIAGITGKITQSDGMLTFDNEMLAFALLIDGRLSPISAPWLMLQMIKGGYIVAPFISVLIVLVGRCCCNTIPS